jgi:hypothetical protein
MGMMVWGLLSLLISLIILFLFILTAAYGVKWVWGHDRPALPRNKALWTS